MSFTSTVQKTFTDPLTGQETPYTFSATAETQTDAETYARSYASMVEYGEDYGGDYTTTVQKVFTDPSTGEETTYLFSASANSIELAETYARAYASMVEYGLVADKWEPTDMAFPREQLYQFIQPSQLEIIESMYPDAVATAYQNALAYVQSYIGAMFDVDAMLSSGDTSSTALTLRLALCLSTVTYVLASSPQYSEVIELHNRQLHTLLKGLKSGNRNFGKNAIAGDPDVRVTIVKRTKTGAKP